MRTPGSLKGIQEQAQFRALGADAAIVVAYGLILPLALLAGTRLGAFNLHARSCRAGGAPRRSQRAVMAGHVETGVSVMRMEEGLDTGAICLARAVPIGADETAGELHDALATQGASLMVQALAGLECGSLACHAQSTDGVPSMPTRSSRRARASIGGPWRPTCTIAFAASRPILAPGSRSSSTASPSASRFSGPRSPKAQAHPGTLLDDRLTIACGVGASTASPEVQARRQATLSAPREFLQGLKLPSALPVSSPKRPECPLQAHHRIGRHPRVGWQMQENGAPVRGRLG